MKVTIEVPDCYAGVILKWASVDRTLSTAQRILEAFEGDEAMSDDANACFDEVADLKQTLNFLHIGAGTNDNQPAGTGPNNA